VSNENISTSDQRVILYIDGFNLYFGLRSKGWQRYYWLNLHELAVHLLKPWQKMARIKYFTSHVRDNPDKQRRQITFLEALETLPDLDIFYGKYQVNEQKCRQCGAVWPVPSEKMTDVNIAVEMLTDAFQDRFDTAILVSADSDLIGPVRAIRRLFPSKRLVVAFPPSRFSHALKQEVVSKPFFLTEDVFRKSQFPDEIVKPDGFVLRRPREWV
jgi:hypothetical protein